MKDYINEIEKKLVRLKQAVDKNEKAPREDWERSGTDAINAIDTLFKEMRVISDAHESNCPDYEKRGFFDTPKCETCKKLREFRDDANYYKGEILSGM